MLIEEAVERHAELVRIRDKYVPELKRLHKEADKALEDNRNGVPRSDRAFGSAMRQWDEASKQMEGVHKEIAELEFIIDGNPSALSSGAL